MNNKQLQISKLALFVSALSLLLSAAIAFNQYKEKVEVVMDELRVASIDFEEGYVTFEADVILANTSQSTISLMRSDVYVNGNKQKITTTPDMPISLVQGYAEKVMVNFRYKLSAEEQAALKKGEQPAEALKKAGASLRFFSARKKSYSVYLRFSEACKTINSRSK